MKKIIAYALFLFVLMLLPHCNAESWDDFANLDRAWDGQKTVTDKEFEEVMDALQAKTKKKEAKKRQKLIKKISGGGTSLHSEMAPENDIDKFQNFKSKDEGFLINLPVDVYVNDEILERGYYSVIADKDKDNHAYINFYQSQFLKARLQVIETNSDFGEEEVNFAKVIPYGEHFIKIIFGSLTFNAYAIIPIKEDF